MPDWGALTRRFDSPGVRAIFLLGSHARGDAGPFSDIDLARIADEGARIEPADGCCDIEGHLVVVCTYGPKEIEKWFTCTEVAVGIVAGLRSAVPLLDHEGDFAALQERARAFTWDLEMQEKAQAWVSAEMVSWLEEVHKGLAGLVLLKRGESLSDEVIGRLLNARFGCSWGLTRVVTVLKGLLLTSDNTFYDETAVAMGEDSEWVRLRRIAFGLEDEKGIAPTLQEQVAAGLRLYAHTAELVRHSLQPQHDSMVRAAAMLIQGTLGDPSLRITLSW